MPPRQLVQRDVDGAVDVAGGELGGAADVEDDAPGGGGGPGPGRRRSPARRCPAAFVGPCPAACRWRPRPGGRCRSGPVPAAPAATWLGRVAEQGERGAPRDQPAEVGGEGAVEAEVERAGTCPAAKAVRWRRSTTHSPASMPVAAAPPARAGAGRSGPARRVPRGWPGPCGRSRRGRRPARPSSSRRSVPRSRSGRGWCRFSCPMVEVVAVGLGGGAEDCRSRGWGTPRRRRAARSARRCAEAYWCVDQVVGVLGAEQVRAAGGAVQQRPAGEHADRLDRAGVVEGVGQVGERVPGGGERPHPHRSVTDRHRRRLGRGAVEAARRRRR